MLACSGTAELKRVKLYKPRTVQEITWQNDIAQKKKKKFSRALVMDSVAFSYMTLSRSAPVATCVSQWTGA